MNAYRLTTLVLAGMAMSAPPAHAQYTVSGGGRGPIAIVAGEGKVITDSAPIEVTQVKNAPFAAQAVTEFTQTLADGNRIERRYQSSVARDSRGRTRREEEIALIGPLFTAANGGTSRLVTIVDPDLGVTYTLDDEKRVASRSVAAADKKLLELNKLVESLKVNTAGPVKGAGGRGAAAAADLEKVQALRQKLAETGEQGASQDLGTRMIEGVRAQGTRTTTVIAAGAIGNARPIEIVSERWFSPDLQMPVLITRRDPRNGETTYRLTNILRGEQQDGLFTIPAGYEVRDSKFQFTVNKKF